MLGESRAHTHTMDDCSSEPANDMNDIVKAVFFPLLSRVLLFFYMKRRIRAEYNAGVYFVFITMQKNKTFVYFQGKFDDIFALLTRIERERI